MKSKQYNVLITGATGFTGAHLLSRLIQKKNVRTIFVVSRQVDRHNMVHNATSLIPVFAKYSLPFSGLSSKVRVIYGDISKERIGISAALYPQLSKIIDVIYHVAAEVNHMKSAEALEAANVSSVRELIDFSRQHQNKIINFVSTMGVALDQDDQGIFLETMPSQSNTTFSMGYLASKHKAEQWLSQSGSSNIFRLGYVSGHSKTGVSLSHKNQLMMLVKSCIQLGVAPDLDRTLNLTPVDFVADVLQSDVFLESSSTVLHVVNNKEWITWRELIQKLNGAGYPVQLLSIPEWQSLFVKCNRSNALYSMKLKYRRKDMNDHVLLFGRNIHQYSFDNLNRFCKSHDIQQHKIKDDYIDTILGYLQTSGFLDTPQAQRIAV